MADVKTFTVDVGRFLRPVSPEDPGGDHLRYEGTYDRIREARREDDASLPQGIWQRELKRADWALAERLCAEALESRSKDLEIAAWLLEAWMHLHGFAGVREGAAVIHALCGTFWEEMYPRLDADDPEARNPPFEWINERLSITLASLKVTRPEAPDAVAYSWLEWQEAIRQESVRREVPPAQRGAPRPEPPLTRSRVMAGVTLTPRRFYERLDRELRDARDTVHALQALLDERLGRGAPSLVRFAGTLTAIHEWTRQVLEDKPAPEEEEPEKIPVPALVGTEPVQEEAPVKIEVEGEGPVRRARAITTRDEAYRQLSEISEYLLRTEPHSPTPFLLQRAVAWGGMSLSDLLQEFLRDGYDLKTLRVFLGMVEPGSPR